ncbi:MAG: hypothetical protein NZM07_05195 [Elioraea sp.]|nr:hypothetical protein [Elioraea sp.]MDW8399110.1 hypothetical protein [Acetobacteraceae bacterium]
MSDRLAPLDVVWVFDREAIDRRTGAQGKWKALVVMASHQPTGSLVFFRINSVAQTRRGPRPGSVPIAKEPHHRFLDHDSFLFCGGPPVVLTEPQLQAAMSGQSIPQRHGIVGRIHASLVPAIVAAVEKSAELSETLRAFILDSLRQP